MSNPQGINQYTKSGGKKKRAIPAGKEHLYATKALKRAIKQEAFDSRVRQTQRDSAKQGVVLNHSAALRKLGY